MMSRNRTPLAWRMLVHKKGRLLVSLAGVAFAATLMFVEMGFLNGLYDSQTHLIELFNADLVMINKQKEATIPRRPFPRTRLQQALGHPQVTAVYPVYLEDFDSAWKSWPLRRERGILVYGINPDDPVFLIPEVAAQAAGLKQPYTALADSEGWPNVVGPVAAGVEGELGHHAVRLIGTFPLGVDLNCDGSLLVSEQTFFKCFTDPRTGSSPFDHVEFGLIKVAPGADPAAVRDALRKWLPTDVAVMTKGQLVDQIKDYWATTQPVGFVFGLGTAVGFLIGVTICYQILYTDVMDHLPQFATLKAMGYSNRFLIGVTLQEGVYLGALGFLPGLAVAVGAYEAVHAFSRMLMFLTPGRIALVFVLTVLMCAFSGMLAIRRVIRADPAEVFS
jgi:putative ABC transport system permease protein